MGGTDIKKGVDSSSVKESSRDKRLIFISHTNADSELAAAMKAMLESAYSGYIEPYVSSDPTPAGGIMPGENWFASLHEKLLRAESVWVLATKVSILRPWIYWESGAGMALSPGGVVVVRVGLELDEILSPLDRFQTYDGLDRKETSSLIEKVAAQLGLALDPVLVEHCATKWLEFAKDHKPTKVEEGKEAQLSPERVNRLEAVAARLEAVASSVSSGTVSTPSTRRLDRGSVLERARQIHLSLKRQVNPGRTLIATSSNPFDGLRCCLENQVICGVMLSDGSNGLRDLITP